MNSFQELNRHVVTWRTECFLNGSIPSFAEELAFLDDINMDEGQWLKFVKQVGSGMYAPIPK